MATAIEPSSFPLPVSVPVLQDEPTPRRGSERASQVSRAPLRVGWVVTSKKFLKFRDRHLFDLRHRSDVRYTLLELDKPLEAQEPVDIVLHKITDWMVRESDPTTAAEINQLSRFVAERRIPLIDPFDRVRPLLNRLHVHELLNAAALQSPRFGRVRSPRALVAAGESLERLGQPNACPLRFPLICKNATACGSSLSHQMAIVTEPQGLVHLADWLGADFEWIVQEFIDHDAVLYKVYVLGDDVFVSKTRSLANIQNAVRKSKSAVVPFNSHSLPTPHDLHHREHDLRPLLSPQTLLLHGEHHTGAANDQSPLTLGESMGTVSSTAAMSRASSVTSFTDPSQSLSSPFHHQGSLSQFSGPATALSVLGTSSSSLTASGLSSGWSEIAATGIGGGTGSARAASVHSLDTGITMITHPSPNANSSHANGTPNTSQHQGRASPGGDESSPRRPVRQALKADIDVVAHQLREHLQLQVFGFDLFLSRSPPAAPGNGAHLGERKEQQRGPSARKAQVPDKELAMYIVDVNYFPSFKNVSNFRDRLATFLVAQYEQLARQPQDGAARR